MIFLDMVQKYIGSEGETPRLHRMGGSEWAKAKADWYHPTISREDAYLGKRKHDSDSSRKELTEKRWW